MPVLFTFLFFWEGSWSFPHRNLAPTSKNLEKKQRRNLAIPHAAYAHWDEWGGVPACEPFQLLTLGSGFWLIAVKKGRHRSAHGNRRSASSCLTGVNCYYYYRSVMFYFIFQWLSMYIVYVNCVSFFFFPSLFWGEGSLFFLILNKKYLLQQQQ